MLPGQLSKKLAKISSLPMIYYYIILVLALDGHKMAIKLLVCSVAFMFNIFAYVKGYIGTDYIHITKVCLFAVQYDILSCYVIFI